MLSINNRELFINQFEVLTKLLSNILKSGLFSFTILVSSVLLFCFSSDKVHAQNTNTLNSGSVSPNAVDEKYQPDSLLSNAVDQPVSLKVNADSVQRLPLQKPVNDTAAAGTTKGQTIGLTGKVHSYAEDSIRNDLIAQKRFLYKNAKIEYEDIVLTADYIEIDFKNSIAYATGLPDSTGVIRGYPVFKEGQSTYEAKEIRYNYDTKKGLIKGVFTNEDDGYLHGKTIKRFPDNTINIKDGSYTTCDLPEHPHYEFRFSKAKVIPGDLIVTGPAYFTLEGLPTPLWLPFGIFPNKSGRRSGILIPTYGESTDRGFFFENGGYYWAINDYMDLTLIGDIYTKGSYAFKPKFRYNKRYRYSGDLDFSWARNNTGDKGDPDFAQANSFLFKWQHAQDPKANPNSRFNANVNIQSTNYKQFNPINVGDQLASSFNSSVTYSKSWNGNYNLTVGARHSQNNTTKVVDITFPELDFSVNRFYPLRRKKPSGKLRWYENISVSYTTQAQNRYQEIDSLLFQRNWQDNLQNGLIHKVPIQSNVKVLKYFNWNNSLSLTDRMYFYSFDNSFQTIKDKDGNEVVELVKDTIRGFNNQWDFSFNSALTTKIYGQVNMRKGVVRAVRHVFTPSVSFNYTPDFAADKYNYYQNVLNPETNEYQKVYRFDELYGRPPNMRSGSVSFNFVNNLEMKVRDRKDTITGTRKIKLIENFTINGSYNLAADSLNWSKIRMSGRTTLFKNANITYSSLWDPYILNEEGTRNLNKFEWDVNHRLLRLDNTDWSIGFNYVLNNDTFKKKAFRNNQQEQDESQGETETAIDAFENNQPDLFGNREGMLGQESNPEWGVPWSLTLSYNLNYMVRHEFAQYIHTAEREIVQTMNFSGQIELTKNWKVNFTSGWDFKNNELAYTSMDIYRDLHCWEMKFNWIPIGPYKSWRFGINIKAPAFKDFKYEKKRDFRDNFDNNF